MRLGSLEFRPGRWPTLITAALLGLLSSLGFWQLNRAEQTRVLLGQYQAPAQTVLLLEPHQSSFEDLQFQSAEASGHYEGSRQFLLDNMTHEGHVGYHVLTPFKLAHSNTAVLVNRGWIPAGVSRARLPDPDVKEIPRRIMGRLKVPTERFMLGEEEPRQGWPYRIQRIRIAELEKELGYPLLPVVLLLDEQQADGYVREWRPVRYGPERNIGYAFQWFGLALALLIIYLVVNTRKVT